MNFIGCLASSKNLKAISLKNDLKEKFGSKIIFFNEINDFTEYELNNKNLSTLIVLGGDGFMIRVLHSVLHNSLDVKIYGINCGHLGFLLNERGNVDELFEKIEQSIEISLNPLQIELKTRDEMTHKIFAINEISLLRQTYQSIHINVFVNGVLRIPNLSGDGALISTAAGSAAYNKSSGGTILPIQSRMLCLTGINPFRPKAWKSAVIPDSANFEFRLENVKERPALACADFNQYYFVNNVKAYINKKVSYILLFDKNFDIQEKILQEQFSFCF